jgi:phospholipase C
MPPAGLDNLKHIVVLMMENRSFDHMLGALMKQNRKINGLTGNESNPDTTGATVKVQPNAQFQSQLDPDPDHHFPGVDLQVFGGQPQGPNRVANMQGFVKDYFTQTNDVNRSHNIMYYFTPDKLPVITTLATEFALFNGWFSSIPGPTICNRAFAHYGTSFGQIGMDIFYALDKIPSIYERMVQANHSAKIYYYDQQSSTMEIVNILKNQPQIFANYDQFISDCKNNLLPEYSFIEPCYNDHSGSDGGAILASDQHPDHNVQEGERFMANTFNAIRTNPDLWKSTALLVVYDEHGGIYDHVVPPTRPPPGPALLSASIASASVFRPFSSRRGFLAAPSSPVPKTPPTSRFSSTPPFRIPSPISSSMATRNAPSVKPNPKPFSACSPTPCAQTMTASSSISKEPARTSWPLT